MKTAIGVLCAVAAFSTAGAQTRPVHTYSIVARDPATGELGVAVQSHWFCVGCIVAWAVAARLDGHGSPVFSVAFSPDGKALASGLMDGRIFLWDLTTQPASSTSIAAHMNPVFGLAFDPRGRRLASGSSDKTISLWEIPGLNRLPGKLGGYASNVYNIAFHPDGELLAAGLADGTVALWNVAGGNQPARDVRAEESGKALASSRVGFTLALGGSSSAAFSPTEDIVVAASGKTLEGWKSATRESVPINYTGAPVMEVAFDPAGGGTLATAACANWNVEEKRCTRGEIQFWDAAASRPLGPALGAHKGWLSVAFHPDGKTLVSAGSDDERRQRRFLGRLDAAAGSRHAGRQPPRARGRLQPGRQASRLGRTKQRHQRLGGWLQAQTAALQQARVLRAEPRVQSRQPHAGLGEQGSTHRSLGRRVRRAKRIAARGVGICLNRRVQF